MAVFAGVLPNRSIVCFCSCFDCFIHVLSFFSVFPSFLLLLFQYSSIFFCFPSCSFFNFVTCFLAFFIHCFLCFFNFSGIFLPVGALFDINTPRSPNCRTAHFHIFPGKSKATLRLRRSRRRFSLLLNHQRNE